MSAMNAELFDALSEVAKEKGITPEILVEKIQTALVIAVKRDYPNSEDITFNIDITKGKFDVCINKIIVETADDVMDDANEIDLESAMKVSKRSKVGGTCSIKLNTRHFGRIAAQTAKQVIRQGIKEVEREQLLEQWGGLQNQAMNVKVEKVEPDTGNAVVAIVTPETTTEVVLFKNDQIPGEVIYGGDTIKVYISGVSANDRRPTLRISRTHNNFVRKLFESEIPEVADGTVEIRAVSREPGIRSKVAVFSNVEDVDAIGACIGPGRSRITSICDELCGEKIDMLLYDENPHEFIKQALKPAEVTGVEIPHDEEGEIVERVCTVTVPDNQLSLAIGNKGQNAKLAARLTGFKIDIRPESGFYSDRSTNDNDATGEIGESEEFTNNND
ncbi:MAG: transcription termination factor NusA [Oscillospiraceae bacterium]|nr:transcription termination factor NusA [Oscillospiraceae bacterium]